MSRKNKTVKVVHVHHHHYHHSNPDAHPYRKDPNHPDHSGELNVGKLIDKFEKDPKGTIAEFLLAMILR